MTLGDRFRRKPTITVHVLIRGRIGGDWIDVDSALKLPFEVTLSQAIEIGDRRGLPLTVALEHSPHLRDTIMLNGERCPLGENRERLLADGDELYLLAPIAGG